MGFCLFLVLLGHGERQSAGWQVLQSSRVVVLGDRHLHIPCLVCRLRREGRRAFVECGFALMNVEWVAERQLGKPIPLFDL